MEVNFVKRFITFILVCAIALGICSVGVMAINYEEKTDTAIIVESHPNASQYLASYRAWTARDASGVLSVSFTVNATSRQTNVGVTQIAVQRWNGSSWTTVRSYFSATTTGMLGNNTNVHIGSIIHNGTVGGEYRALVVVFSGSSSSNDQRLLTTNSTVI
jgi:hypothetical protein